MWGKVVFRQLDTNYSAHTSSRICIWQPGLEPRPSNQMAGTGSSESFVSRPAMDFGLSTTLETGHRANIFSVKWAPHNSDRLISCAGDSEVNILSSRTVLLPLANSTLTH